MIIKSLLAHVTISTLVIKLPHPGRQYLLNYLWCIEERLYYVWLGLLRFTGKRIPRIKVVLVLSVSAYLPLRVSVPFVKESALLNTEVRRAVLMFSSIFDLSGSMPHVGLGGVPCSFDGSFNIGAFLLQTCGPGTSTSHWTACRRRGELVPPSGIAPGSGREEAEFDRRGRDETAGAEEAVSAVMFFSEISPYSYISYIPSFHTMRVWIF